MMNASWPYQRIQNYTWLGGIEHLPKKICDYLMDFPGVGYTPPQTNDYPRVRLGKYLYYDDAHPLESPALTTEQKISLIFDPFHPTDPPSEKGYRVFPLEYVQQAQKKAQTILRCYIGSIVPRDVYSAQIGIVFEILTSYSYENNTKSVSLSRSLAIEQCIWESLNGVNIDGIGTMYMDRRQLADCGSYEINDERTNVGRRMTMGLSWRDSSAPPNTMFCG